MDEIAVEHNGAESVSPSGRVQDLRRQWVLHEDEALAHRLQDEEIVQHYAGNRTRNAIVREDAPKARQEQLKEEEEAIEKRLRYLSLVQRQAEKDAQLAQNLAKKYESNFQNSNSNHVELHPVADGELESSVDDMCLVGGAACLPQPGTSRDIRRDTDTFIPEEDEDYLRQLQEQRDAELARKVQEELEQHERDQRLALETQDRELARILYEKDKARLKRAKERAKLKAAALNKSEDQDSASVTSSVLDQRDQVALIGKDKNYDHVVYRNRHTENPLSRSSTQTPPRIPDKYCDDGPVLGFKANPKKLPPQPNSPRSARGGHLNLDDPVPPYMPIHGFNRNSPKRQK